ncbi:MULTISPECIES: hypothetical protein [unclassified Rhodococcus (in: high G+C Gram-positive bacteria)]|uniref:hypothetical protein n=1 Tax=unclassified Rhodococcus (in: high G+C Gram-positive bacteria) TaxID=192944 RepID=UPI0005E6C4A7|nr:MULTISPECIES: hypothetical protein [unclassified Rhodococcus (in: high G+C Gram-positive bacteria)]KJF19183.1 hypothetical protein SZ00_06110 [Rhodococcus sp. AD45]
MATFRLILALASLICIAWGIAVLLAIAQPVGWVLIAIGLITGAINVACKGRD